MYPLLGPTQPLILPQMNNKKSSNEKKVQGNPSFVMYLTHGTTQ